MNVRIKNRNLRFKISEEELNSLLGGSPVHAKVEMLDKTLVTSINPAGSNDLMETKLILGEEEAYLNLLISHAQLQNLSDMMPDPIGLKQKTGNLSITLMVDMPEACHR